MLQTLMAAINSPGGHILICCGFLLWFSHFSDAQSHDIVVFAIGILARSMGVVNKATDHLPPNTISHSTETKEVLSVEPKKEQQ